MYAHWVAVGMHTFVCIPYFILRDAKHFSLGHVPVAVVFIWRGDEVILETLPLTLHSEWWKRHSDKRCLLTLWRCTGLLVLTTWNQLPLPLRQASSLQSFRSNLKTHLFPQ